MTVTIHKQDNALRKYYQMMNELAAQGIQHEGGTKPAFSQLLRELGKRRKLVLHEEYSRKAQGAQNIIRVDGALVDDFRRPFAYWEAKDSSDNLQLEIQKKLANGYPSSNIIFEDTRIAVLFQDGREVQRARMQRRDELTQLLSQYLSHQAQAFDSFRQAAERYKEQINRIASGLKDKIDQARQHNRAFQGSFEQLMTLCQESLNPNISRDAVDDMLIQHLMTERIISKVFDLSNFASINVIASEINAVINDLTSAHWNLAEFYGELEAFHRAVESAADPLDFHEKQGFINSVYERFFQSYSDDTADTHGIVYTPREIVDFMCRAVDDALRSEFGVKLGDEGIIIIDPATGTGNFVVQLLRHVHQHNFRNFSDFYRERLFANEVLLMPYYIASLNIEHTYYELANMREAFTGLCFVDTLDLARQRQLSYLTQENTERVKRQQEADINVIIGNPPYNVGQLNENDNNKNRKYDAIDKRIRETYAKDSKATNKNALSDVYVKFWRWAVDRLGDRPGIVCYVTNNSFVDQIAFDGMRKHMLQDFDDIYHLDLHGNVRQNPKLSGTTHNVFGIQVGVGITLAIRGAKKS